MLSDPTHRVSSYVFLSTSLPKGIRMRRRMMDRHAATTVHQNDAAAMNGLNASASSASNEPNDSDMLFFSL